LTDFHAISAGPEIVEMYNFNEQNQIWLQIKFDASQIAYGGPFNGQYYTLELKKQNCYLKGIQY
jgi:hypothetical protein